MSASHSERVHIVSEGNRQGQEQNERVHKNSGARGLMELVNETLGGYEPFPVEFSFQDDPQWEGYSRFLQVTC
jgi:hypothetical protein